MTTKKPQPPLDLSKGYLPIIAALGLFGMVAGSAYTIGQWVAVLKNDNDRAGEKFKNIDTELTAIRTLIEGSGFVRRIDFELWCRNTEALNRGFKCGNIK